MTKSKSAAIAALFMGAAALTAAPPAFAKKDEAPKAAPLKLSDAFRKPAAAAQAAITAKNWDAAAAALAQADAVAQSDDEKGVAARLRLSYENSKLQATANGDQAAIARGMVALVPALSALIDNPTTPKDEVAKFSVFRGNLYFDSKKYTEALADFERARSLGVTDQDVSLQIMKSKAELGDAAGAMAELERQIDVEKAAGRKVPEAWYRYVLARLVKAKMGPESVKLSLQLITDYPTEQSWRQGVGVYASAIAPAVRLDVRQRLDLLRLLRAAHALADQNDYDEYAQATDDTGLAVETKSVIAEGMANGKLPKTDSVANMLNKAAVEAAAQDTPVATLETRARAAKTGDLSAQTADVYLGMGEYAKAVSLYREALTKGFDAPVATSKRHFLNADEVNTHLGIALALSGDKAGAKTVFQSVTGTPRADIAKFWITWLDVGSTPAAPATAK